MNRKARKITALTLLIVVGVFFAGNSRGQGNASAVREFGGMGYSMFGRSIINLTDLNKKFESNGYSTISEKFFAVGGGGHAIINNRLIIGGEGYSLLGESVTSGNYTNSVIAGCGFINVGYNIFSVKDFRIYPLAGLGAGVMNLKIYEDIESLSFDEILQIPARSSVMSKGGLVLNLALGAEYLLKFTEDESGRGGMLLGVRAGYTVSPFKGKLGMDEIEISGAPKMGITGPYIRIMIGGGAIGKE